MKLLIANFAFSFRNPSKINFNFYCVPRKLINFNFYYMSFENRLILIFIILISTFIFFPRFANYSQVYIILLKGERIVAALELSVASAKENQNSLILSFCLSLFLIV